MCQIIKVITWSQVGKLPNTMNTGVTKLLPRTVPKIPGPKPSVALIARPISQSNQEQIVQHLFSQQKIFKERRNKGRFKKSFSKNKCGRKHPFTQNHLITNKKSKLTYQKITQITQKPTFIIASANSELFPLIIDRMKLLSKLQKQKPKLFESKKTLHNACENIKTKPRWPPRLLPRRTGQLLYFRRS